MRRPETIRPDFLRDFCVRDRAAWDERHRILRERDNAHRDLNREIGVANSSSFAPHAGANYDRRYKEIQRHYGAHYDAISERERAWRTCSDMTIPECLYLDNFTFDLEQVVERPDFDNLYWSRLIELKAETQIGHWKKDRNLAGITAAVEGEIRLFRYARRRCREQFTLRPWHFSAQRQIARYRDDYFTALRDALGRLRVA